MEDRRQYSMFELLAYKDGVILFNISDPKSGLEIERKGS
jgi:hypothetical protein